MNLQHELNLFLRTEHARKPSTTRTYGDVLRQFVEYCTHHPSPDPAPLSVLVCDFLSSKTLAPSTHNQYLSIAGTFLYARKLISRNDRDELHRKRARIDPQLYGEPALQPDQFNAFFTWLRKGNARTNPLRQQRDLCIFLLQYGCALGISEVLTLTRADVSRDEDQNALMIRIRKEHTKNGVEQIVPLRFRLAVAGLSIAAELQSWLQISVLSEVPPSRNAAQARPSSDELVFFNLRKTEYGTPITYRRMINKYNSIMQRLGIVTSGSTRAMRHTGITALTNDSSISMSVIAEFAGHFSKGPSTSLYIQRPKPTEIAGLV